MANVTVTTAANWIPELWSRLIQEAFHSNVVIPNRLDRSLEPEVMSMGDQIHVPHFAEIAAATTTGQPSTVTFSANTEGVHTLTINQFTDNAVLVNSVAQIQSMPPILDKYTKELGRALMDEIEIQLALEFKNYNGGTQEGTDDVSITEAVFNSAVETLNGNKVPHGTADRSGFVSPKGTMDLLGIERFTNQLNRSALNATLQAERGHGWIGDIYDFAMYESTNLESESGNSGKTYALLHREATQVAIQKEVRVELRQPHDEYADAIRAWVLWGKQEARDTAAISILGR